MEGGQRGRASPSHGPAGRAGAARRAPAAGIAAPCRSAGARTAAGRSGRRAL